MARITGENELANPYIVFIAIMIGAIAVVVGDLLTPRKRIQTISAFYFGVIVGIFLSESHHATPSSRPCNSTWTRRCTWRFERVHDLHLLRLRVDPSANQGRLSLHHPLRGVLQGGQGGAAAGAGHLGRD